MTPARYRIIEEGGAETIITAVSYDDAISEAQKWVADGSYDAAGTVRAWVVQIDEHGDPVDGPSGAATRMCVAVGAPSAARALRRIPSEARSAASRENGKRGGRPRRRQP